MNAKYSFSRYVIATLAVAAVLVLLTACKDDLGYQGIEGQQIAFKLTAPDAWHDGMPINENAPTTHCTSVRALSGGDTKLYLHTVVADNPAEEKAVVSRGTPVKDTDAFERTYFQFSLSGIYTDASLQNVYNLHYESAMGTPMNIGKQLLWPSKGGIEVYAFAPTVEDFNNSLKTNADGSLTDISTGNNASLELNETNPPTLTYTVSTDVTKQVDLMMAHTSISSTTTQPVELQFGHALTAVQIKCGKDMLAGKITEVTIKGIYGKGTWKFESISDSDSEKKGWNIEESETFTYTISKEITLSPGKDATDKIHVPEGTSITGTDTDNLTFMLLPQTLPTGATMTIKFIDDATKTERTLSGSLGGHKWEAGKIVTYSVSPSSIHVSSKFEFSKKGTTADKPDTIPYSGVWYDAAYTAKAEVTQEDVETKAIDIPADKVKFQYRLKNSDPWTDCTKDANGLLTIAAQPAYTAMNNGFSKDSLGSETTPFSLSDEFGETANCYMVDKAGYYTLPLVYGNGYLTLPEGNADGFNYFPKHDDTQIFAKEISGVEDAVLCWQDAPDLIDPASVHISNNMLVFHIRKHTLAQGNALLAVRGTDSSTGKKIILWSWHIWVTPYKDAFYNQFYHSKTYSDENKTTTIGEYDFAQYNLGWCDHHAHNESRIFSLQAIIDMSAYGGTTETVVIPGTFMQMEFKGSDAGDNTYYQWGRKDPMLGGIYNDNTPNYRYKKKGTSLDANEFTMENKQVFNQYNKDGYNYSFCKNLGDAIDKNDYASNGVTIGYAIQHPYMFVTNSRCNDGGDDPTPDFNYRNHWHKPYKEEHVDYLDEGTHIMFNAWDAGATHAGASDNSDSKYYYNNVFSSTGTIKESVKADYLTSNAANVKKSVYDPCPPKFKIPPIDAFRGIAKASKSNDGYYGLGSVSFSNNTCIMTMSDGQSITFPITGVRNYALRSNEWKTVEPTGAESEEGKKSFYETFYRTSMPAFKMLSFVSSATIVKKEEYNAYQLLIFAIDKKIRTDPYSAGNIKMSCFTTSSNSYGMPVRPIKEQP